MNDIDVLILAGGQGTRLQSVVSDRPKAMAEIDDHPFLDILIDYVSSFGVRRFVLCTGHMAEYFLNYCRAKDSNVEIVLSAEKKPLGTGGAVKHAESLIETDLFLVMNGDSFCCLDISDFYSFHIEKNALVSMVVTRAEDVKDYGLITLDDSQRITSFEEKKQSSEKAYINAGMYLFERSVLDLIPRNLKYSLEEELFPSLTCERFFGYAFDGELIDIGTPERYKYAQKYFLKKLRKL